MALYLVRHAKAGSRDRWDGPDQLRPLTKPGRAQSLALADWLATAGVPRILSSPYVRCAQTVEPLAEKLGLEVEITEDLTEATSFEPALQLIATVADHTVLCSHGDLIPDVIEALARRGMIVDGQPDWRKGSTWVLERTDGQVVRAHAVPPG
jgi:phosphohistidine phosphatase SixA